MIIMLLFYYLMINWNAKFILFCGLHQQSRWNLVYNFYKLQSLKSVKSSGNVSKEMAVCDGGMSCRLDGISPAHEFHFISVLYCSISCSADKTLISKSNRLHVSRQTRHMTAACAALKKKKGDAVKT